MWYYAVARGRVPGIYNTWSECFKQVNGYPNARYKKFKTIPEADKFMNDNKSIKVYIPQSKLITPKNSVHKVHNTIQLNDTLTYENNRLVIWTDGACRNNGTNKELAGAGVYYADNHEYNIAHKMIGNQQCPVTNNRAEMTAVILALKQCHEYNHNLIEIRTDSKYIIDVITKYMSNWIRTNKTTYMNKDLWDQIMKLKDGIDIKWTHVRGHVGIYGNEQADMLANQAIDM